MSRSNKSKLGSPLLLLTVAPATITGLVLGFIGEPDYLLYAGLSGLAVLATVVVMELWPGRGLQRRIRATRDCIEALEAGELAARIPKPQAADEIARLQCSVNVMAATMQRHAEEARRVESALRESQDRYRSLIEAAPDAIVVHQNGIVTFANPKAVKLFGAADAAQIRGLSILKLVHPQDRALAGERMKRAYRNSGSLKFREMRMLRVDGRSIDVETIAIAITDGGQPAAQSVIRDISERKRAQEVQTRLLAILEATPDFVGIADTDGSILYLNHAARRMIGFGAHEKSSTMALIDCYPDWARRSVQEEMLPMAVNEGSWSGEAAIQQRNGLEIMVSQVVLAHKADDGTIAYFSIVARDITERKLAEDRIYYLAHHDPLTGLANRRLFQDRLDQALAAARRQGERLAVLLLDLDHFKDVNDTLGHPAGDQLLFAVAERFSVTIRDADTLARLSGDEFAILQLGLRDAAGADALARKLLKTLKESFVIEGQQIHASASIGIALFPDDATESRQLIQNADMALYRVKAEGRNGHQRFKPIMVDEIRERKRLERELRRALDQDELRLHYQPQLDLRSGAITGVEALVRWQHPQKGLVLPGLFIPVAEATGLVHDLGEWVLREACRQAAVWREHGIPLSVAVNLSPAQLKREEFAMLVNRVLKHSRLDPSMLEFEITESLFMDPSVLVMTATLRKLTALGVQLSIDDFGTGYSSLAYLRRFPVNNIKIDRSFIRDLAHDPEDEAIVKAILALSDSLGKRVVAEGVENKTQLDFLLAQRCDHAQGFLIGRPLPAGELIGFLDSWPASWRKLRQPVQASGRRQRVY